MQSRVHMLQGDITTIAVDVIVNAANSSLLGGGGVDGAIHRAAGPALLEACKQVIQQQGECPTGHAVITLAGALPAKAVIHTVGPVWQGGDLHEAERLEEAYLNTLQLALANGYQSIAFPCYKHRSLWLPTCCSGRDRGENGVEIYHRRTLPDQIYFVCFDEEKRSTIQEITLPNKAMNARTDMTRLERAITPLCVNHPGECGILTLDDSPDAFAARYRLTEMAERIPDVQYYIWESDMSGLLLFNEMVTPLPGTMLRTGFHSENYHGKHCAHWYRSG